MLHAAFARRSDQVGPWNPREQRNAVELNELTNASSARTVSQCVFNVDSVRCGKQNRRSPGPVCLSGAAQCNHNPRSSRLRAAAAAGRVRACVACWWLQGGFNVEEPQARARHGGAAAEQRPREGGSRTSGTASEADVGARPGGRRARRASRRGRARSSSQARSSAASVFGCLAPETLLNVRSCSAQWS